MGCGQAKEAKLAAQPEIVDSPTLLAMSSEEKARWPLQDDAERVFGLATVDSSEQLDWSELASLQTSSEMAEIMQKSMDTGLSGIVSKEEFCAYFKKLSERDEKTASRVLEMYEKQLSYEKISQFAEIAVVDMTSPAFRNNKSCDSEVVNSDATLPLKGKRALVLTSGSRGDCQPFMALSIGLRQAGCDAVLFSNPDFEEMANAMGLTFKSNGIVYKDMFVSEGNSEAVKSGNFLKHLEEVGKNTAKYGPDMAERLFNLLSSEKWDFVVAGTSHWVDVIWIWSIFKIPYCLVNLSNKFTPNSVEAPFGLPSCPRSVGILNLAVWKLVVQSWTSDLTKAYSGALEKLSGRKVAEFFPTASDVWETFGGGRLFSHVPYFIAQEALIAPHEPWSVAPWMVYTGALSLQSESQVGDEFGDDADGSFEKFLTDGAAPVYIGWGSIPCGSAAEMGLLAVRSIKLAGRRGVVLGGWRGLTVEEAVTGQQDEEGLRSYCAENIRFVSSATHSELFPKCAVIVHHGGAGTTMAALKSGRPSVITPGMYDQFESAKMVSRKGVGVDAGHLPTVTPEALAGHINSCIENDAMVSAAQQLGEQLRSKDGVTTVTQLIGQWMEEDVITGEFARKQMLAFSARANGSSFLCM